jgi:hypothetical protein
MAAEKRVEPERDAWFARNHGKTATPEYLVFLPLGEPVWVQGDRDEGWALSVFVSCAAEGDTIVSHFTELQSSLGEFRYSKGVRRDAWLRVLRVKPHGITVCDEVLEYFEKVLGVEVARD